MSAVNAAEVLAKLVNRGMPAAEAEAAYNALHLETKSFEAEQVVVSTRYVCKGVSLGDRCFLATAERYGDGWTGDRELGTMLGSLAPPLNFFR